jgi:hypothetical protein
MTLSKNTVRKTTISRVIEAQSGSGSKQDEDDCRCQEKCSQFPGGREFVTPRVSKPHDYANHMFVRL